MKFRAALLLIALQGCLTPTLAQNSNENGALKAQRQAIDGQRADAQRLYAQDAAACYQVFAVNECLKAADMRKRATLGDLRRQEISLNDAERKRKGAEQVQRIEDKSSAEQQQEQADRRAQALQAQQDRDDKSVQKRDARADKRNAEPAKKAERIAKDADAQAKAAARSQRVRDANERRRVQEEKNKEADQRRADVAKRLAEQDKPPAAPLPLKP